MRFRISAIWVVVTRYTAAITDDISPCGTTNRIATPHDGRALTSPSGFKMQGDLRIALHFSFRPSRDETGRHKNLSMTIL